MMYIVTEYASNGEMFGNYFFSDNHLFEYI